MSAFTRIWPVFAVERDRKAECIENATAKLGIGGGERLGEVGERVKDFAGVVEVDRGVCAASVVKLGHCSLEFVASRMQTSPTYASYPDRVAAMTNRFVFLPPRLASGVRGLLV